MLPVLHRGDIVILHGIPTFSKFITSSHVPIIAVTQASFTAMESNMSSEFLAYYAYFGGDKSNISQMIPKNSREYNVSLYNNACVERYVFDDEPSMFGLCYVGKNPSNNLIKYNYTIANITINGTTESIVSTQQISINGVNVEENYSNPIIVYQTNKNDVFTGDTIHRLVAFINVGGAYYTVTKGDNNPEFDIQFGNYPALQSSVVGYVVTSIPVLGYFKLLLSGNFGPTPGCNQVISH